VDRPETSNDLLATGALMSAASVVRAGTGCLELWSERVPPLVRLAAELDEQGDESAKTREEREGRMREELLAVARESAEIVMRELRRGLEDLDTYTRADDQGPGGAARPYRAKP
jgi:hypothetical protein